MTLTAIASTCNRATLSADANLCVRRRCALGTAGDADGNRVFVQPCNPLRRRKPLRAPAIAPRHSALDRERLRFSHVHRSIHPRVHMYSTCRQFTMTHLPVTGVDRD